MKDTNNQGKSLKERLAEAEECRKNATISDIIAAKRREADSIEQSARGSFKVGYSWDDLPFTEKDLEHALDNAAHLRKEADRLEAALKRELAAYEPAMRNFHKLRKALIAAKKYLDGYTVDILKLRRKVDAALAEPTQTPTKEGETK